MLKKLCAIGLLFLATGSTVLADRGDRYRGSDRGDRYSSRSSSGFSVGFGFSSGNYRGNSSYIDIGYSSGRRSYDSFCSTPSYYSPSYSYSYSSYRAPREVIVTRPTYYQPVYVERAPVYIERAPVYYEPAPVVIYPSASSYYRYDSCAPSTYYRSTTSFYYGR